MGIVTWWGVTDAGDGVVSKVPEETGNKVTHPALSANVALEHDCERQQLTG